MSQSPTILITGAGSGIGAAAARAFAEAGWHVFAGVHLPEQVEPLLSSTSAVIHPVLLDVTDPGHIEALRSHIEAHGRLDVVVNNAGIVLRGPLECLSVDAVRESFEVNCFGLLRVTQACLPMLRRSHGRVINLSSVSGLVASPFTGAYAASKFAVEGLSDALRREVAELGVKVIVLEPGPIQTELWAKEAKARRSLPCRCKDQILAYAEHLAHFDRRVDEAARHAEPTEVAVRALLRAATIAHPRARYAVGHGAWAQRLIARWLPDRVIDWLISARGGSSTYRLPPSDGRGMLKGRA